MYICGNPPFSCTTFITWYSSVLLGCSVHICVVLLLMSLYWYSKGFLLGGLGWRPPSPVLVSFSLNENFKHSIWTWTEQLLKMIGSHWELKRKDRTADVSHWSHDNNWDALVTSLWGPQNLHISARDSLLLPAHLLSCQPWFLTEGWDRETG